MISKEQLKWTDEDDLAVEQYKKDLENGKITCIGLDELVRGYTAYFDEATQNE